MSGSDDALKGLKYAGAGICLLKPFSIDTPEFNIFSSPGLFNKKTCMRLSKNLS